MAKKKSMVIAMVAAMVALLVVGGTLALLSDQDSVLNVLNIGNNGGSGDEDKSVKVKIEEPLYDGITGNSKQIDSIIPKEKIMKDPKVTTLGIEAVYVRVYFEDVNNEVITLADMKDLYGVTFDDTVGWMENSADNMLYLNVPLYRDATADQISKKEFYKEANIFKFHDGGKFGNGPLDDKWVTSDGKFTITIKDINNDELDQFNSLKVCVDAVQAKGMTGGTAADWTAAINDGTEISKG